MKSILVLLCVVFLISAVPFAGCELSGDKDDNYAGLLLSVMDKDLCDDPDNPCFMDFAIDGEDKNWDSPDSIFFIDGVYMVSAAIGMDGSVPHERIALQVPGDVTAGATYTEESDDFSAFYIQQDDDPLNSSGYLHFHLYPAGGDTFTLEITQWDIAEKRAEGLFSGTMTEFDVETGDPLTSSITITGGSFDAAME